MREIPEELRDLLERPLFADLATVRPDGTPQVSPMWFIWDGNCLLFTHTDERQRYRNMLHNPTVAVSIMDPADHYRYLELRGRADISPDHDGSFFREIAARYGRDDSRAPADAAHRVVVRVAVDNVSWHRVRRSSR